MSNKKLKAWLVKIDWQIFSVVKEVTLNYFVLKGGGKVEEASCKDGGGTGHCESHEGPTVNKCRLGSGKYEGT